MKSKITIEHWTRKFRNALRGLRAGIVGQTSFYVHFVVTLLVIALGVSLNVSPLEWCVLLLCIGTVISAELFNSALEKCAKAITRDFDDHIRDALDISSGAVLVVALVAAIIGAAIFVFRIGFQLGWWGHYFM